MFSITNIGLNGFGLGRKLYRASGSTHAEWCEGSVSWAESWYFLAECGWPIYIYMVYSKYIFIYIYGISTSFIIWVQYGSMFQWAQGSMSLRKSAIDSIFGAHSSTQLAEAGVERFWHDNMCLMYLRFTFCSNLSSKLTDLRGPSIRKALLSRRKLRGLGLWVKGCMTDDSNLKNDP
jgi:hypothetical protein